MLSQVQKDEAHAKYRAANPILTDEEKTIKWLKRILLPKFFEANKNEVLSAAVAYDLSEQVRVWQRDKVRQDNVVVDIGFTGKSITVKVNQKLICTFN